MGTGLEAWKSLTILTQTWQIWTDVSSSREIYDSHSPSAFPEATAGILMGSIEKTAWALAGVAQWIDQQPVNQTSLVPFSVRAHAWVAGQAPGKAWERQPHIDVSISLFLPVFPSL